MKNTKNKEMKAGFNRQTVQEIIINFNEIDEKIIELHNYSSEDFLNLNKILKNYYENLKIVSENSNDIIDSISGQGFKNFTSNLYNIQSSLHIPLCEIENEIDKQSNIYEKINAILEYLFVPFNNLKQNLISLKLVLTSIKLNESLHLDDHSVLTENSYLINNIKELIAKLALINETTLQPFKSLVKEILLDQYFLKDKKIPELNSIKFNLKSTINLISEKYTDIFSKVPQITKQTQLCFKNIDQIITNLQYHDIIRQKMNHVQDIQKDIIEDLQNYEPESEKFLQSKYIQHIPEIVDLQVAQLLLTNKEYQNAIEKITSELIEISENTQNITAISLQISEEGISSRNFHNSNFKSKQLQLEKILLSFQRLETANKSKISKINSFKEEILLMVIKIKAYENELKTVLKIADNEKNPSQNKKFEVLIQSIEHNNIEIIDQFDQIQTSCLSLETENFDNILRFSGVTNFYDNLFGKLNTEINNHTNSITDLINKNIESSIKISEDVKSSLNSIAYYDQFEKIIEEIITKLNSIYSIIEGLNINNQNSKSITDLNELKKIYTMQSERDIHEQILDKERKLGFSNESAEVQNDEVELF